MDCGVVVLPQKFTINVYVSLYVISYYGSFRLAQLVSIVYAHLDFSSPNSFFSTFECHCDVFAGDDD